jgi:hypothetical protein
MKIASILILLTSFLMVPTTANAVVTISPQISIIDGGGGGGSIDVEPRPACWYRVGLAC